MFWFKRKPIVLNCYTADYSAYTYAKPDHSRKFIPEWWKDIPRSIKPENNFYPSPTIKGCPGFVRLYGNGFIVPMWSDFVMELSAVGNTGYQWKYSDGRSSAESHPMEQIGNHLTLEGYAHLKLLSPWYITCEDDTEFTFMDPIWSTLKNYDYKIVPAVTNFKHQNLTHVNMFFKRSSFTKEIYIDHNTPLYLIMPISDRPLDLRYHLVEKKEIDRFNQMSYTKFVGSYNYQRKLEKQNESR